jgi:hypothetical protein
VLAPMAAASATNPSLGRMSELHLIIVLSASTPYCLSTQGPGVHCVSLSLARTNFFTSMGDRCKTIGVAVDINHGSVLQMPGLPGPPWMDCERRPHDVPVLWTRPRARQAWASEPLQVRTAIHANVDTLHAAHANFANVPSTALALARLRHPSSLQDESCVQALLCCALQGCAGSAGRAMRKLGRVSSSVACALGLHRVAASATRAKQARSAALVMSVMLRDQNRPLDQTPP